MIGEVEQVTSPAQLSAISPSQSEPELLGHTNFNFRTSQFQCYITCGMLCQYGDIKAIQVLNVL